MQDKKTWDRFLKLQDRINYAKKKHKDPSFVALVSEVGELADCYEKGLDPKDELLDIATVALRLYERSEIPHTEA